MLNQQFLDDCLRYIVCDRNLTTGIYEYTENDIYILKEIQYIISMNIKDNDNMISMTESLLLSSIDLISNRKDIQSPKALVSSMGKENYETIKPFLEEKLVDGQMIEIRKSVNNMYKMMNLFKEKSQLKNLIDLMESKGSENLYDTYIKFKDIISKVYIDSVIRGSNLEDVDDQNSEFVCYDIAEMKEKMKKLYESNSDKIFFKLDSRFDRFMSFFKKNALESKRVHIFAAQPGGGKSTFLLNMFQSFTKNIKNYVVDHKGHSIKNVIYVPIYITLENQIDESLERFIYCHSADLNKTEIYNFINSIEKADENGEYEFIMNQMDSWSNGISKDQDGVPFPYIFKYLKPSVTTINDVIAEIEHSLSKIKDKVKDKGIEVKPGPIIIDYLDLMSSISNKFDMYRLSLGDIVLEMKSLSILYKVPVITATQLNNLRSDINKIGLDNMTESKKKGEHADFVGFLLDTNSDENNIQTPTNHVDTTLVIRKHRNGKLGNVSMDRFLNCYYFQEKNKYSKPINMGSGSSKYNDLSFRKKTDNTKQDYNFDVLDEQMF